VGRVQEEECQDIEKTAEVVAPVDGPLIAIARAEIPSIAILPFTNVSGDPEQDYFADGMADEIIRALSRCPWLLVIARNSSFTYKSRTIDVR
jgi:TolB-like protein